MELQQTGQQASHVGTTTSKRAYVQLGGLLAIAVVALLVIWLLVGRGSGSSHVAIPPVGKVAIVNEAQLRALAKQTKFPIYWAGAKSGVAYELTRTKDGRIYVRYLTSPRELGTKAAKYLTVGTYPSKDPFVSVRRAAQRHGGLSLKIANGGLLVFNTATPTSVHFAYPSGKYQVEVYDPSPAQARALVLGGKITPIR